MKDEIWLWGTSIAAALGIGVVLIAFAFFVFSVADFGHSPGESQVRVELSASEHGSGVYLGDGLVLTAAHVVEGAGAATVVMGEHRFEGRVVARAANDVDAALIRFDDTLTPPAARWTCREPQRGEAITIFGEPLDFSNVETHGVMAMDGPPPGKPKLRLAAATIAPGSSGGPVFDSTGSLLGIAVGMRMILVYMFAVPSGFAAITPMSEICQAFGWN